MGPPNMRSIIGLAVDRDVLALGGQLPDVEVLLEEVQHPGHRQGLEVPAALGATQHAAEQRGDTTPPGAPESLKSGVEVQRSGGHGDPCFRIGNPADALERIRTREAARSR